MTQIVPSAARIDPWVTSKFGGSKTTFGPGVGGRNRELGTARGSGATGEEDIIFR